MNIENHTDKLVMFSDVMGVKYRLLGRIYDQSANYIIYESNEDSVEDTPNGPMTYRRRFIEEVCGSSNDLITLLNYEVKQIEDDILFTKLMDMATKEGILNPIKIENNNEQA